jgi:hypothetical protein
VLTCGLYFHVYISIGKHGIDFRCYCTGLAWTLSCCHVSGLVCLAVYGPPTFKGLYDEFNKRIPDAVRVLSGDGEAGLQAWRAFQPRCAQKLCVVLVSTKKGMVSLYCEGFARVVPVYDARVLCVTFTEPTVMYKGLAAVPAFTNSTLFAQMVVTSMDAMSPELARMLHVDAVPKLVVVRGEAVFAFDGDMAHDKMRKFVSMYMSAKK